MSFITHLTPEDYRSLYNPIIGFSNEVAVKVNQFIHLRVELFLKRLSLESSDVEFVVLRDTITDKEFSASSTELANSYFYQIIFNSISKEIDGKIREKPKLCITFDKDLTPLVIDGISYGYIQIATKPILYYVLFDLFELIKVSKS
jgi:hypothetical protein